MRSYYLSSSLFGFKYANGVLIASDTLLSYGNLAKDECTKIVELRNGCMVCFSGEYADAQYIIRQLKKEDITSNGTLTPKGYHRYIQRIMYSKRSRMENLNNGVIVGGIEDGLFLGAVDHRGNFYYSDIISHGIGAYIVTPYLRSINLKDKSREEAIEIAKEAQRLLFYRSTKASNKIQIAIMEEEISEILNIQQIESDWEIGRNVV